MLGSCLCANDQPCSSSYYPTLRAKPGQNHTNAEALLCAILQLLLPARIGTLWEGRYKATLIDSKAYLLRCMRYIELNPLRAGMVIDPSGYPWSSYHHNALGQPNDLVVPHPEYQRLGESSEARQTAYRDLFKNQLSENSITEIREATNKAWVLGNDRFKQSIQEQLERRVEPKARGGDRKSEQFLSNLPLSFNETTSS